MKILVVAPHADDEALGCGGTIASLVDRGHEVTVFIVTDRVIGNVRDGAYVRKVHGEAIGARRILGYQRAVMLGMADEGLGGAVIDVIKKITPNVLDATPDIVFAPFSYDLNQEHRKVAEAVRVIFRPYAASSVAAIYAYEIPGTTELSLWKRFTPSVYEDIGRYFEKKIAAVECYESERRSMYHPRSLDSLRALARRRGAEAGVQYAEAFEIVFQRGIMSW